jgi:ATP-dependent exoDNAse (exonuclease V) beta subunit
MSKVIDNPARARALEVATSFIVQAPAGSGKTELLTQRYLALLDCVDCPEEVLAITFTRKAAGEMRNRILNALEGAEGVEPETDHGRITWRLAKRVRERDSDRGWCLMDSPGRLKIMTIDAFHAVLSRQLPILSGAGGTLSVADRPELLYREAARKTLCSAWEGDDAAAAARQLLAHLDNRFERAEDMLTSLLARRDQWRARVTGSGTLSEPERRQWLEGSIRRQLESGLTIISAYCPRRLREELPALADYAAGSLVEAGRDSPIRGCLGLTSWPEPSVEFMPAWKGLAELLLTGAGSVRKRITVSQGFAPAGEQQRETMTNLLGLLEQHPDFVRLLAELRTFPGHRYGPGQWSILNQLLVLLPRCAAELEVVMREQGKGDYVAISDTARRALQHEDGPTDLALALDYRIRHILVDEFQDTSAAQVELLRLLTAGWEAGDGRSLFCVGDPMQSIYGFREAEVGLFLDVRRLGRIEEVPVEPLNLEVNFRSAAGVVDWVNDVFPTVMPGYEDPRLGAVPFVPAKAFNPAVPEAPVCYHAFECDDDGSREAVRVRTVVESIRGSDPDASIGILVRSRNLLERIAPELKLAGIRFQAVEIERLANRQVIQDLMALTRALSHPADRTAWLACLRAPWCGLTLDELEIVAGDSRRTIPEHIRDSDVLARLSPGGRQRLDRFSSVIASAASEQGRRPLHRRVEGAWLALGGPAALDTAAALDDARSFIQRLERLQTGSELEDPADLENALSDLFASPDPQAGSTLQLMTIHKAKGLEFDYVLLPGLHRGTSRGNLELLHWLEFPQPDGSRDLLLASIEERGRDRDPLHRYIRSQESKKTGYELGRLLYVAVTRARRQLHLFGSIRFREDGESRWPRPPAEGTLLDLLWGHCEEDFLNALEDRQESQAVETATPKPAVGFFRRLPANWQLPELPGSIQWKSTAESAEAATEDVEYWWAGRSSRAVGTVVHRWLERLAADNLDAWTPGRIQAQSGTVVRMLREEGLGPEDAKSAAERVLRALVDTVTDESGRWLLAGSHRDARSEYALAGMDGGQLVHAVIDRFIVDANGDTWVVDYKTGEHTGGDLDGFLSREVERYRPQLEKYGRLVSGVHETGQVKLGLYFPLHTAFKWWSATSQREP